MTVIIISSVLIIVNVVLWIVFFKKIRKEFSGQGSLQEIKQEVDKLVIEISRETDQDITLVEAKCEELRNLLDKCDRKISLLNENLIRKSDEQKIVEVLNEKPQTKAVEKKASTKKTKNAYESNFQLFTDNAGTPEFKITKAEKPIEPKVPVKDQVVKMVREGFSSEMIASKLNISIAQVEMTKSMME